MNEDLCRIEFENSEWGRFHVPELAPGIPPEIKRTDAGNGWERVHVAWSLSDDVDVDEVSIPFRIGFTPDFWWAPHLAPEPGDCIAQHVFRSPAVIAARGRDIFILVPDLDLCGRASGQPWFLDVDAPARTCWLGIARTEVRSHVLYRKHPGLHLEKGRVELAFFVRAYKAEGRVFDPWAEVSSFLWNRWARPLYAQGQPTRVPLDRYVEHTYKWAFENWKDAVWQEFDLNGRRVGAPCFIVNTTQSPNYRGEPNFREFLSIWNQAWFSSLRSASGLMRYASRYNDAGLREKAELTKAFALAAPQQSGIFPTVYGSRMKSIEIDGHEYNRPEGWASGHWTNSNRTPRERGVSDEWYHVLDMSWTGLLMLRWHDEIAKDGALVDFARAYGDKLLSMQDKGGFFPAWLNPQTLAPSGTLDDSPETSMSVTFLLKLAALTGNEAYRAAALKALDAVVREVVPQGRWEDFETYWSCCPWGRDRFVGKKLTRNDMYKQCNFSMFWTAEALLEAYRASRDTQYLDWGLRTLHELSMTQQVWQPPFIHIPALGGFGVMNCDGEWNDARQSLFAELFMQYYKETGDPQLFERGVAALKASFVMMYCPENPEQKALWEKVWPFFGREDYGFAMENYGHGGATSAEGEGMGEFTIYDWGNGAAAEARNRVWDHFGDVYVDRVRKQAFGIDSIHAASSGNGCCLTDLAGAPRDIRIVFEDASSRTVRLDQPVEIEY